MPLTVVSVTMYVLKPGKAGVALYEDMYKDEVCGDAAASGRCKNVRCSVAATFKFIRMSTRDAHATRS